MLKIKVHGYNLMQKFHTYFKQEYETYAFKYTEYDNSGLFVFRDYDPIEVIYENILKNYHNDDDFSIKIKPEAGWYIKVIIKPLDYDKND